VALLARVGAEASYVDVLIPVALLGAGLTLTVTPLTTTVLGAVGAEHAGLASGINNAVARTGGLVLVAVLPALTGLGPGGFADPDALQPAYRTAMLTCSALLAVGAGVAWFALRRHAATPVPDEPGAERMATCPPRHCSVAAPPVAVTAATPQGSPHHLSGDG
jgi:hypothetical protein